jgi:carbon storage regulator
MPILTRRVGESIVIGDEIVVTIVEAGRDHVRVGIDAPRSVSVHRQEVYAAITRENEAARAGDTTGVLKPRGPVAPATPPPRQRWSMGVYAKIVQSELFRSAKALTSHVAYGQEPRSTLGPWFSSGL